MNAILERINSMGKVFVEFAGPMLIQSSALILILLLVDLVLRKKVRAVFRYWIWMLVLVKLVLPTTLSSPVSLGFLLPVEFPSLQVTETRTAGDAQPVLPAKMETKVSEPINMPAMQVSAKNIEVTQVRALTVSSTVTWQGVVFVVWLAIVIVMVLLLAQRVVFVCGLVAQAKEASPLMNDMLKFCCGQMGVKGTIGLKVSANATSPAVCGLFRPVILVPQDLGSSVGARGLRAVLTHELAHIKRGDLWVNLVQTLLQIVYFYNPLLWLANAMIRRVREQAVDEAVLVAMGEKAQQYPEILLNVAKLAFEQPMLSLRLIGVVESKNALSARIKHILSRPIPKSAKISIWGLVAILIFGAVLLPMAKGEEHQRALKGIDEKLNISDKTGELIIKSLYMEPPEGKKIIEGNYVNLLVEVANNSPKGIFLGLEYYTHSGTVAVFFSPGATGTTRIREIPANWQGKVEYPIDYARFVKNGYIQIILAKCHSNQLKESKSQLFLPDDAEMLYEKKYPIDLSENAKSDNTATMDSVYTATLPNGVTVGLVGVCDYPAGGKRCWRPDGLELHKKIYAAKWNKKPVPGDYGFMFKVNGPQDLSFSWNKIDGTKSWEGSCKVIDENGNQLEGFEAAISDMLEEKITTSIKIGVATGHWKTIVTSNGGKMAIPESKDILFSQAYESNNFVGITVSSPWHKDRVERIVAVDKSGQIHITKDTGSVASGEIDQMTAKFYDLKLKDISEFQFQTRPYEWVELRNVSLKPGTKTDVQIGAAEQVSSGAGEDSQKSAGQEWKVKTEERADKITGREQIEIEASVYSIQNGAGSLRDFLKKEIVSEGAFAEGRWTKPIALNDVEEDKFCKFIKAMEGITVVSAPKVRVFDGEDVEMRHDEYVVGYEETVEGKRANKKQITTSMKLAFRPQLRQEEKTILLQVNFEDRNLLGVHTKADDSGNIIELPETELQSIQTVVGIETGKTVLLPIGGTYSPSDSNEGVQIILLIKTQIQPLRQNKTSNKDGEEIIKAAEFVEPNKSVSRAHKVYKTPVVIKTVPAVFADDVLAELDKITVTFDQPMMDRSWSWTGGGKTYPQTAGKPYYDSSRITCTLPVKLEAGKVYWVGINSPSYKNFQTKGHIPAKRYVILFATKGSDGKATPIPEDMLAEAKAINEQAEKTGTEIGTAERKPIDGKVVGIGPGWEWLKRTVGNYYGGSIGGYSNDEGKCSEYFDKVLSWARRGDTFVMMFSFDDTYFVPEKYRYLLPEPWSEIESRVRQGQEVELEGKSHGLNTVVLAAPTFGQLESLIQRTELLKAFKKTDEQEKTGSAESAAVEAAQRWLKLIDDGDYGKSWDEAAGIFKSAVTKEQWESSVKAVRIPLGKVISREVRSKVYTKRLPGAPDGEYVVIEFNTSFENKKAAVETVTPTLDKDGIWRVSGYYIK